MSDWLKINSEEVSREHRQKVFDGAALFLKENALANNEASGRRFWLKGLVAGVAAAVVAVVYVVRPSKKEEPVAEKTPSVSGEDFLGAAPLLQMDIDLLSDLDMIEDLEVLKNWEPS